MVFPLMPVVGAIGLALALILVWRQNFRTITQRPVNRGLALLGVVLLVTACFADNRFDALAGLGNFLPFLAFFAGFSVLIQSTTQLRQMAWAIVLSSIPVVILGLGQILGGWSGIDLRPIFGWMLQPGGNPLGRMSSVFNYANTLAAYLQIPFVLGLGLWIEESNKLLSQVKARRKRDNETRRQGDIHSSPSSPSPPLPFSPSLTWLGLSALQIGSAIALVLTNSRNAWAIIILSCLAFALYQGWRILVGIAIAIAASVIGAAFAPNPIQQWLRAIVPAFFWARLNDQLYPDRTPETFRTTQWQFAWKLTEARPWTGWGLRSFTPLYEAHSHVWLGHPHNLVLMLTAETGIPATILFLSLVGWVLAKAVWLSIRLSSAELAPTRLFLFTYLLAFGGCMLFNLTDVTIFDFRVNTLSWLLLSAIGGAIEQHRVTNGITSLSHERSK
jgi:O-antigen ligase